MSIQQQMMAQQIPASSTPTLVSANIDTTGLILTLNFSISCTNGAGGSGGVTISASGGACTLSFSSGSPGSAFAYGSFSRTINAGETVTVSYTQPGNGIEGTIGTIDLASFATQPVTNNSTAGSTITIIAKVQNTSSVDNTVIIPSTTAGDSIIIGVMSTNAVIAASDNIGGGTGWNHTTARTTLTPQNVVFWYKDNVPSGITTISFTAGVIYQLFAVVVRGLNTSGSFTTGEENGGGSTSATTSPNTGNVTNATASSILFALFGSDSGANPITMTPAGGWTLDATNLQQVDGSSRYGGNMVYQIVSSSTARSHTWTTTSAGYCVAIAAFHV